jgi:hypothetical protein
VDEPLLLHSLSEHGELIFGALEAARPRRVVEIGSETGGFSKELLDWTGAHGAELVTVEPFPTPEMRALAAEHDHFELVSERSPAALGGIAPADAYVIDGDHNYWTVIRELRAAYAGDNLPLSILHDVGWPWARRDLYYEPKAVPAAGRHDHSFERAVHPDRDELVANGGFHGEFQFAAALEHGGERNGVLTAVEDFLSERPELAFRKLPVVFGVGFVYPAEADWASSVEELLDPWHGSRLAERLERNRVRLYVHVLDLQAQARRRGMRASRDALAIEDRLEQLEAENAALRLEAQRLRAQLADGAAAPPLRQP